MMCVLMEDFFSFNWECRKELVGFQFQCLYFLFFEWNWKCTWVSGLACQNTVVFWSFAFWRMKCIGMKCMVQKLSFVFV